MEQSSVMAAPGALRAALLRKQLASALPYLNELLEARVEKWRTISLQLGRWSHRKYNEEDVVKGYVSTGRTFTTRNLAGSCTRTETSLG
jgi:hypothetical protein